MRFLTETQCQEWLVEQHLEGISADRLPTSRQRPGYQFKIPEDPGVRIAMCRTLWRESAPKDDVERLLVVKGWGVWPSGEHFPLFDRLRQRFGENRHLFDVPGHLFEKGDDDDGLSFLIVATLFLWDYWLYSNVGVVVFGSHDEFGIVFESSEHPTPSLRAGLKLLDVLR